MYVIGTASASRWPPTRTSSTSARLLALAQPAAVPRARGSRRPRRRRCGACARTPRPDCRGRPPADRRAYPCAPTNASAPQLACLLLRRGSSDGAARRFALAPRRPLRPRPASASPSPRSRPRGTEIMATSSSGSLVMTTPPGTRGRCTWSWSPMSSARHVERRSRAAGRRAAPRRESVHELLEQAAVRHAFGFALEVERHFGLRSSGRRGCARSRRAAACPSPGGAGSAGRARAGRSPSIWSVMTVFAPAAAD